MYGFIMWVALPLIGVMPALAVREDLRRLNMKEVEKSVYLEETMIMKSTVEERHSFLRHRRIIADDATIERLHLYEEIEARRSMRIESMSVRLTTDASIRKKHGSQDIGSDSMRSSSPLIKRREQNDVVFLKKNTNLAGVGDIGIATPGRKL